MSIPFLFILEMSSLTDKYTLFRMKNVLFFAFGSESEGRLGF